MDFNDTKEEADFRLEVKSWLKENASKGEKVGGRYDAIDVQEDALSRARDWQAKKAEAGYAAITWPKEFGGYGGSPIQQVIYSQEEHDYLVPSGYFEIGIGMLGPTMMVWGKDEDKKRYLPKMITGEEIWCQLFSEPSAGSDLAGIKMKAEKDGDEWVLNGQKVWTSGAHFADYGMIVARSDPSALKHKGLTYFYLDMKTPGIEVRPIKQISGTSNFNEVFFNDVRIPDSQRLGGEGEGWKVALTTLMNERLAVGDAGGADVEDAFRWAKTQDNLGEPLLNNKAARESIADWYCEKSGLKNTKLRTMSALSRGDTPGPEASITKIVSANKLQAIGNFGMDSSDMSGMLMDEESDFIKFQMAWMGAAGLRIAGGTDEILKNIIAERVLGLPQEARADKGLAFKDIPSGS